MLSTVTAIAGAYLLGSLMGGLLIGRLRGVDIRNLGSRSAGGTNALRTQGPWFALAVVCIDVGKGWLAAGPWAAAWAGAAGTLPTPEALAGLCGAAAAVGHVYPVLFGFRGGKAAATLLGAVLAIFPLAVLPALGVWLLTIATTGYVGLATILAGAAAALGIGLLHPGGFTSATGLFGIVMSLMLVFTHRSNIARMRAGNENRFERARLFRRR